jgi:hypothetical protein
MRGAIPPLPNTPSWGGARLKRTDNSTFYLYLYFTLNFNYHLNPLNSFREGKEEGNLLWIMRSFYTYFERTQKDISRNRWYDLNKAVSTISL